MVGSPTPSESYPPARPAVKRTNPSVMFPRERIGGDGPRGTFSHASHPYLAAEAQAATDPTHDDDLRSIIFSGLPSSALFNESFVRPIMIRFRRATPERLSLCRFFGIDRSSYETKPTPRLTVSPNEARTSLDIICSENIAEPGCEQFPRTKPIRSEVVSMKLVGWVSEAQPTSRCSRQLPVGFASLTHLVPPVAKQRKTAPGWFSPNEARTSFRRSGMFRKRRRASGYSRFPRTKPIRPEVVSTKSVVLLLQMHPESRRNIWHKNRLWNRFGPGATRFRTRNPCVMARALIHGFRVRNRVAPIHQI